VGNTIDFIDKKISPHANQESTAVTRPWFSFFFKRVLDILGALIGLVFLWPVFAYIAIRIKHDSPGPVYYHGPRSGLNNKIFQIHKFRTMYESPESYNGSPLTAKNDKRITSFGEWLRDTKINELPQLWNVLKGDMSFVGPRPEYPGIADSWPEEVRNEVLSVRPGITSPASVVYRNEEDLLSSQSVMDDYLRTILPEKLRLDQLYVRYFSILGDLDVIFMTLTLLLPMWRTSKVAERRLFEGPFSWILRKLISWLLVDTVVAFLSISLVVLLWRASAPLDVGLERMILTAIALSLGLAITNTLFGVKNITWRYASPIHVLDLAFSTAVAMLFFIGISEIYSEIHLPAPMLVQFGIFAFFGFVVVRYRERLITGLGSRWIRWRAQSSRLGERVLVIGAGDCGQLAIWLLEKSKLSPLFSIVGLVDDDLRKVSQRVNGIPVLGTMRDLPDIVKKKSIGLVLFAINKIRPGERDRILKQVHELPVRVLVIPELLDVLSNYFSQQVRKAEADHG
jgi:lipopolysaccharide/colanic/teichoic acid biosynthesis glycosyltransferase